MTAAAPTTTQAPGHQRLTLPVSSQYWKGWDSQRGLSELVANAVDEDTDFTYEWSDGALVIQDDAHGIGDHGLILGLSEKTDAQIGQFGEGLLAAMAVLARAPDIGHIRVETVGYAFEPLLVRASLTAAGAPDPGRELPEMLALDIEPCDRQRGTRVRVQCSQELAEAVRARFLFLTDPAYQAPPAHGRVLDEPGGRLYIGGVFVSANPKLLFSYDFALATAKQFQNRDRTVLDANELDRLIAGALAHLHDETLIQRWVHTALHGKLARGEQAFAATNANPAARRAMRAVAKAMFAGRKVTWADGHEDEEAVLDLRDRGYEVLQASALAGYAQHRLFAALGVQPARSIHRKAPARQKTTWVKTSALTGPERDVLNTAVRMVRGVYGPDAVDRCDAYEATSLEGADEDLRWGGFYCPKSGRIGLQRRNLADLDTTLDVLVHEAAHRLRHRAHGNYDYADRTRGFEWQLGQMAARALRLAHDANAIPDPDELAAAHAHAQTAQAAADAEHPANVMRARIAALAAATNLPAAELADECGVSVGTLRQLTKGKYRMWGPVRRPDGAPTLRRTRAVCERLGVEWSVAHLAVLCENLWLAPYTDEHGRVLQFGFSRRGRAMNGDRAGQGRVMGARGDEMQACIDRLRELGVDPAVLAGVQGQLDAAFDGADGAWLAPYRELIAAHAGA